MRRLVGFILIVLLGLSGLQCSKATDPAPPEPDPGPDPNPVDFTAADKELAASTNGFAFELFQDVVEYEDANENIFISPLSISYALGMTRNGAEGDTWQAMVTQMCRMHPGPLISPMMRVSPFPMGIASRLRPAVVMFHSSGCSRDPMPEWRTS